MSDYYVFATAEQAQACIDAINNTSWFPVVGKVNGQPAPDNCKTTSWCDVARELTSGEFAVPRIPSRILEDLEVPQSERDIFAAAFAQDIRDLTGDDFVVAEIEE